MSALDDYWQRELVVQLLTPFSRLRPRIFKDGDQWCALYGEDLQSGVAGFGATPRAAETAFDLAWETP